MKKSYTDLPIELTIKIAEHIDFHQDFENFGLVCTTWRNSMKLTSRFASSRQTPWLMIPPEPFLKVSSTARFYRLYDHSIRHVNLPSLDNDNDNDNEGEEEDYNGESYFAKEKKYHRHLNSSRGWLVCLDDAGATKKNISLVHPFTRERIRIPALPRKMTSRMLCTYCAEDEDAYVNNDSIFALSECPITTSHYTLAIIFIKPCSLIYTAGFWNSKDEKWVVIPKLPYLERVTDITFYKGEFYVVDSKGRMVVASGFDDAIRPLITQPTWACLDRWSRLRDKVYLVESAGMLLQVLRCYPDLTLPKYIDQRVSRFKVWEVNVDKGETKEVKSLGNRALFLGPNSCFSMEASPYCCKPNCIYCVSDFGHNENMGIYDITSGQKIEDHICPIVATTSTSFWVEAPSSCCNKS